MYEEEYDWKMLSMLKGSNTRNIIKKVTDKENWSRKDALDDEFFEASMKGKI